MEIKRLQAENAQLALDAVRRIKDPDGSRSTLNIEYMRRFLLKPENILIVASEKAEPVGFLPAYVLDRVDRDQPMVCLYEIGVVESFQRRGVGTEMINCLKEVCGRIDAMKTWVITNRSNTAAVTLYERSGAVADSDGDIVTFTYSPESWERV